MDSGLVWIIVGIVVLIIAIILIRNNKNKTVKENDYETSNAEASNVDFEDNDIDEKLFNDFHQYLKSTDEFVHSFEGVRLDEESIKRFNESYSRYNLEPYSVPFSEIIQSDLIANLIGLRIKSLSLNQEKGFNLLNFFEGYFSPVSIQRAADFLQTSLSENKNNVIGGTRFDASPHSFNFLLHFGKALGQLNEELENARCLKAMTEFLLKFYVDFMNKFFDYGIIKALPEEEQQAQNCVNDMDVLIQDTYGEKKNDNSLNITDINENTDLDSLLNELNSLIGLNKVKEEVNNLINLVKVRKLRENQGLKQVPLSLHLVFSGNPGTGKTTVARILAQIYKELGVLSKGQLIETDRSGLVAGYVGQTALKTQEVIDKAKGGILFIDEAYTLTHNSTSDDFGQEAIDTILKAMEDYRDDFVVIVAGYPDLMKNFLKSNPGLESRFNTFIDFEDYDPDELCEILKVICEKNNYIIPQYLNYDIRKYFKSIYENRNDSYANARTVRNFFENAVKKQANRVTSLINPSKEDLQTFTEADLF